jgi:hypothetical protein
VGGNRKQKQGGGTSFQELNEMAKKEAAAGGGGDMEALMRQMGLDPKDLQKMMGDIDPSLLQEMANMGPAFDDMMKIMADMSPDELELQMKQAMELFAGSDMMDSMLENQDQILKSLEEMGVVDPGELARFKADPQYFQQKMKDGIGQMKDLFSNPETIKLATESMKGATDMFQNPDKLNAMMAEMMNGLKDEDIEEARQMILGEGGLGNNPMLKQMLAASGATVDLEEVEAMLKDPKKFRETVKEGIKVGTGTGEL